MGGRIRVRISSLVFARRPLRSAVWEPAKQGRIRGVDNRDRSHAFGSGHGLPSRTPAQIGGRGDAVHEANLGNPEP